MKKIALAVWNWLMGRAGEIANLIEKPAEICIKVVNVIKDYVFNPALDILAALTSTGIDNKIIDIIRKFLPDVLVKMMMGEGIITEVANGDFHSVINLFGKFITGLAAANRGKWWADLTAWLLPIIAGKPVEKPMAMAVTQALYFKTSA